MPINIDGFVVLRVSLLYKEKIATKLSDMQKIFAYQALHLSRRLLIGLLIICGMFPSLVQAEIWHRTGTSGMRDVAVAPNGLIWLTDKNGSVWKSDNIYGSSFTQIEAGTCGFSRISVGPDGTVWTIGPNGTLWKFAAGNWAKTAVNGIKDVAIAPDGKVWLAGENGAIWFSRDQGKKFTQIETSPTDFSRISVGRGGIVWAVGSNGKLWKFAAGSWTKTAASGIGDVAIAPKGLIWLAGKNGVIWSSPDDGVTLHQDEQANGIESIAAGRGGAWAVGFNGTLWRKLFSPQF